MLKQAHTPNLFMLVGQPGNGKTTLSDWFGKLLRCPVIHTDQVYLAWLQNNHPKSYRAARNNIRGYYPRMTAEQQRQWNAYLTTYILAVAARAPLDVVAEGWLLLNLPKQQRAKLEEHTTTMIVTMQRYQAHTEKRVIRPKGRDYTRVVDELVQQMSYYKGIHFMRKSVKYQSFEDIREFQGTSDSGGKWLALDLPLTMRGKRVLDVGCGTGYFSIRCWQRGADVTGIDLRFKHVKIADRIAHAVYRTNEVSFVLADFFEFYAQQPYDYILAVTILPSMGSRMQEFFDRAYDLLAPNGLLIVETVVAAARKQHPQHDEIYIEQTDVVDPQTKILLAYPNERAILTMANKFALVYRGRSVRLRGDKRRRVYHFRKPGDQCEAYPHPQPVLHPGSISSG